MLITRCYNSKYLVVRYSKPSHAFFSHWTWWTSKHCIRARHRSSRRSRIILSKVIWKKDIDFSTAFWAEGLASHGYIFAMSLWLLSYPFFRVKLYIWINLIVLFSEAWINYDNERRESNQCTFDNSSWSTNFLGISFSISEKDVAV